MHSAATVVIRAAIALAVLAVLNGCAGAPAPPPAEAVSAPVIERPAFAPDRTYAVMIRPESSGPSPLTVLCDVTVSTTYRLRYNRFGWPTCSAREIYVGLTGLTADAPTVQRWPLTDGRWLEILPMIDVGAGIDGPPRVGRYALAALSARPGEIEVLTGSLLVYRVQPRRIHFLGETAEDGAPSERDGKTFAALFFEIFPEVDSSRLETAPATRITVACEPFRSLGAEAATLGFNCRGSRGGARDFARRAAY